MSTNYWCHKLFLSSDQSRIFERLIIISLSIIQIERHSCTIYESNFHRFWTISNVAFSITALEVELSNWQKTPHICCPVVMLCLLVTIWRILTCVVDNPCVMSLRVPPPLFSKRTDIFHVLWRSCEVLKLWYSGLDFSNCSEIWQTPMKQHCRDACHISKWYDNYNIQSHSYETSHEILR